MFLRNCGIVLFAFRDVARLSLRRQNDLWWQQLVNSQRIRARRRSQQLAREYWHPREWASAIRGREDGAMRPRLSERRSQQTINRRAHKRTVTQYRQASGETSCVPHRPMG